MLLVKNKLKRLKKTIDDDDMLNYLKYSHIDILNDNNDNNNKKKNNNNKNIKDKATQFPEMMNKSTQTINTANKGVDTGNDFDEVIPPYVSLMHSEDFDRNEKMVQVWTRMFPENLTPSPPSSSSSSSSSSSEGFLSKTARRGFRLAEFALNTAIVGANLTTTVANALVDLTSAPHQSSEEEEEEAVNNPEVISVQSRSSRASGEASSSPETINSSSSDVEQVPIVISSSSSSRQTPSSLPAPTSPQPSSPASSAKTTPRKKSK